MLPQRGDSARHRVGACLRRREALGEAESRQESPHRPFGPRRQGHADIATHRARGQAEADLMTPKDKISAAITNARGGIAIVAFVTAGYPRREKFREHLTQIGNEADVVEIGVPFTDPMADGMTIQRSSREALRQGFSLRWLLDELESMQGQ